MRVERVHDAFGRDREAPVRALPDGTVVVESADAIPLDPSRLDVRAASSRGFGELIARAGPCERLLVCLGGTATMDAGAGLLEVLDELPAPTTVLCDTRATLAEAPRLFGPQKGALADDVTELERRFADNAQSLAQLPGSGAAGGLGAALASLGAELVGGAAYVLEAIGFRERAALADLVVTGEGTVDRTSFEGKAPGEAAACVRGARRALPALRRPRGGRGRGARVERRPCACAGRPGGARRRSRRRVAASPSPGAAATRCARRSPRAGGSPRT